MNNMRLFPSFSLLSGSTDNDSLFLEELKKIKKETDSSYVNFSYYEYVDETATTTHFVTYPMNWITLYIKSQFLDIDPLFKLDFRLISHIDWNDIQKTKITEKLFSSFEDYDLGNCGITVANHYENNAYGILSIVYYMDKKLWNNYKQKNMSKFRLLNERLTLDYNKIYNQTQGSEYKITKREQDCLYWMALGKTDDQIAEIMSIGKWTVVAHVKSAKFKLGTSNRASTVAKAISIGIVNISNTA